MKVFLSWSGPKSRAVAEALNDFLKRVIQAVKPFYSPEIEKGAKWSSEIDGALEGTHFGIVCLTPDNLNSTWIHFETGALSKTEGSLVWTFLHGLTPEDIPPPLGKFQHTVAAKDDVLRLLRSINGRLGEVGGEPLQDKLLEENFELFWERLAQRLNEAESGAAAPPAAPHVEGAARSRNERAVLGEILELVRSQERRLLNIEERLEVPRPQAAAPQEPRPPKRSYYKNIWIPFAPSTPNADDLAKTFKNILLQFAPGAAATIKDTELGKELSVTFNPPLRNDKVDALLTLCSHATGHTIQTWGGGASDYPD